MEKNSYHWKPGAHAPGDAQVVGDRIEAIRQEHGGQLQAAQLVEDAKEESSVLHDYFEWDDPAAAKQYRIDQAGYLIRALEVEVHVEDSKITHVRAFVSIKDGATHYTTVVAAMSDKEMRREVIQRAFRELKYWRHRYETYSELGNVFKAIDAALPAAEEPVTA